MSPKSQQTILRMAGALIALGIGAYLAPGLDAAPFLACGGLSILLWLNVSIAKRHDWADEIKSLLANYTAADNTAYSNLRNEFDAGNIKPKALDAWIKHELSLAVHNSKQS